MTELYDLSTDNLLTLNTMNKNIIVFTHVQYGDILMQVPLLDYISNFFKTVYLPVRENTYLNLDIFKNTNIELIKAKPLSNNRFDLYKITELCEFEKKEYHYKLNIGHNDKREFKNESDEWPFEFYYKRFNLNHNIYHNIPQFFKLLKTSNEHIDLLKNRKYIFYSLLSTDGLRHLQIPKILLDNNIVICPDFNVYPQNHENYDIADKFVNLKTSEYINIIENCNMIITLDHGFFWLSLLCDLSKIDIKIVIMRIYYGVKQKYNLNLYLRDKSKGYTIINEENINNIF
jgi:hypothetical protein